MELKVRGGYHHSNNDTSEGQHGFIPWGSNRSHSSLTLIADRDFGFQLQGLRLKSLIKANINF